MYRESLLIIAFVLIIIGVVILAIDGFPESNTIGMVFLICGIILFVLWIVLFAVANIKGT